MSRIQFKGIQIYIYTLRKSNCFKVNSKSNRELLKTVYIISGRFRCLHQEEGGIFAKTNSIAHISWVCWVVAWLNKISIQIIVVPDWCGPYEGALGLQYLRLPVFLAAWRNILLVFHSGNDYYWGRGWRGYNCKITNRAYYYMDRSCKSFLFTGVIPIEKRTRN